MSEFQNNGDELMTDYQFKCYKELRDEREEELRRELEALRKKCEALTQELNTLKNEMQSK